LRKRRKLIKWEEEVVPKFSGGYCETQTYQQEAFVLPFAIWDTQSITTLGSLWVCLRFTGERVWRG